jgi:hypothetical protein
MKGVSMIVLFFSDIIIIFQATYFFSEVRQI